MDQGRPHIAMENDEGISVLSYGQWQQWVLRAMMKRHNVEPELSKLSLGCIFCSIFSMQFVSTHFALSRLIKHKYGANEQGLVSAVTAVT